MKKPKLFRSRILIICMVIAVAYFCVSFFATQSKINAQQSELEGLTGELESLQAENSDMQERLSKGKDADSYEQAAREQYGYVYPDEKVYVVTP